MNRMLKVDKKIVGYRIFQIRSNLRMSMSEFAVLIGSKKSTVSSWEHGLCIPKKEMRKILCELANIAEDELLSNKIVPLPCFMNRLTELRERENLTKQGVADLLDVNRVTYSNWEWGKTEPNIVTIIKISKLYGVSIDYLLGVN